MFASIPDFSPLVLQSGKEAGMSSYVPFSHIPTNESFLFWSLCLVSFTLQVLVGFIIYVNFVSTCSKGLFKYKLVILLDKHC